MRLAPSRRLVHVRIGEDLILIRTAQEARAKAESHHGPMQPTRAESAARERVAYWERYLIRCGQPSAIGRMPVHQKRELEAAA